MGGGVCARTQAQLAQAARGTSKMLDLRPEDLLLYSAKMIPGNEKRVIRLMNGVRSDSRLKTYCSILNCNTVPEWFRLVGTGLGVIALLRPEFDS